MKKIYTLLILIAGALGVIGVFHYFNIVMYEWTRPLVLVPLIYAGMNYRRAGSITVVTVLIAGQAPFALITYARDPSSGMNYVVAGVALSLLGVYVGHVLRKEREIRSVWQQSAKIRNRVRRSGGITEMLSMLEEMFGERGEAERAEVYIFDEACRLVRHDKPNEPPLPEGHLYYKVACSGQFMVSMSVPDDPRIDIGQPDNPAPENEDEQITRLAVFPIEYGGKINGVVAIINSRDENFDNDTVVNLTSIKQPVERFLTLLEKRRTTIQHQLEHDKIRDTFSSYVSRAVADEILRDPEKNGLVGEQRSVTVMFAEVVNFPELQESLAPAELIDMLNEYFSAAMDSIFEHGGIVDKFIGNNIMAFWGAPVETAEAESNAVACALELQDKVELLNRDWGRSGKAGFEVCAGINSGSVIAGNIGGEQRMEYTVIGDTVNTAARIKSAAGDRRTPVLVNDTVYERVKDTFDFRDSFEISVKGKSAPLIVHAPAKETA